MYYTVALENHNTFIVQLPFKISIYYCETFEQISFLHLTKRKIFRYYMSFCQTQSCLYITVASVTMVTRHRGDDIHTYGNTDGMKMQFYNKLCEHYHYCETTVFSEIYQDIRFNLTGLFTIAVWPLYGWNKFFNSNVFFGGVVKSFKWYLDMKDIPDKIHVTSSTENVTPQKIKLN